MFKLDSSERPQFLQWSILFLWISVGWIILLMVTAWFKFPGFPKDVGPPITNTITIALLALIAMKISSGRNWARWLFGFVYVLGTISFFITLILNPQMFKANHLVIQVSTVLQFAIQTAALILMFTYQSNQWFKSKRYVFETEKMES